MKVMQLLRRLPDGGVDALQFDAAEYRVKTEDGWLRVLKGDELMLIVPAHRVEAVAFVTPPEAPEEPRIIKPSGVAPGTGGPRGVVEPS